MIKNSFAFVAKWFVIALVIIAIKGLLGLSGLMPNQPTFEELEAIAERYAVPNIQWTKQDYSLPNTARP